MRIDGKKEPHVYVWLCWGFLLPLWFAVWLISQEYAHMHSHSLLFPFNSLFLSVNLHANAVVRATASLAFFLTHTLSFCLCLGQVEDWRLSLCAEDLFVFVISPFIDCCQGKTPPGDTPEQTWSRICSELRARYPWTFLLSCTLSHLFYLSTSFLLFHLYPVKGKLVSVSEMDRISKQRRS